MTPADLARILAQPGYSLADPSAPLPAQAAETAQFRAIGSQMDSDTPSTLLGRSTGLQGRSRRLAQSVGDAWESELNLQVADMRRRGVAVIHKTGPLTKVTGRTDAGPKLTFVGAGPCDYIGFAVGMPIAFEAKSTASEYVFHVPAERTHQFEFMQDVQRICGGRAFVGYLIEWRARGVIRWHPFDGRKSFRAGDGVLIEDRRIETALRWCLGG